MTTLHTAARQALDFCEFLWREVAMNDYANERLEATTAALRGALEAQQEPKPVALMWQHEETGRVTFTSMDDPYPGKRWHRVPLYAAPQPPQGWVPVTERLPEPDSGEVLVYLSGGMYALDEWHTHREDPLGMSTVHTIDMGYMWRTFDFDEVTHWMPLPPPPKETT
jgi:hypothetical protein